MRRPLALLVCVAALAPLGQSVLAAQPQGSGQAFDVLIKGGQVIDGTGAPEVLEDVGVRDGRIFAVGDLKGASAREVIDAKGLVVAPGFINIHDHAEAAALPTAVNMLTQGVTTALLNPDGSSELDIQKELAEDSKAGLAMNIGAYVGFNSVWEAVVGQDDKRPSPEGVQKMRDLIETNLKMGAFGVSAGLDYKPGYYAKASEVVEVVSVARPWRTNFPNHDRLSPETNWSSKAGVAETIAIASAAGLAPEVTHMKAQGHEQGSAGEILAMMRKAGRSGHYTPADVYPYLAGMTALFAFLVPGWAQAGGPPAMLKRFKDPALRSKIVEEANRVIAARFGEPGNILLPQSGRNLGDLARKDGVSGGEEALRVLEAGEYVAILTFGAEEDLRTFLAAPEVAVACDCGAVVQGAKGDFSGHPRLYGTFPLVLGHYVRDEKLLTLPEAIRKMTGLPASTVGIIDRGFIAPGMAADIAVFDPNTIIDHATFKNPAALSDGVKAVLVGGVVELRGGEPTGAKGGSVLLRTSHMPTRPQSDAPLSHLSGEAVLKSADLATQTVVFDLSRDTQGHATGRVVVKGAKRPRLASTRLGIMQTAPGWAALTGVLAGDGAVETPFSLILDASDPLSPAGGRVLLSLGGAPWREGPSAFAISAAGAPAAP